MIFYGKTGLCFFLSVLFSAKLTDLVVLGGLSKHRRPLKIAVPEPVVICRLLVALPFMS
jgi:hypothetical protein